MPVQRLTTIEPDRESLTAAAPVPKGTQRDVELRSQTKLDLKVPSNKIVPFKPTESPKFNSSSEEQNNSSSSMQDKQSEPRIKLVSELEHTDQSLKHVADLHMDETLQIEKRTSSEEEPEMFNNSTKMG